MHHRKSNIPRQNNSTVGAGRQMRVQNNNGHSSKPGGRNSLQDTAANDRYMPVIHADIFNQSPGLFQRLPFLSSTWVMRIFLVLAITGSVFYIYPGSLKSLSSGFDKIVNLFNNTEVGVTKRKASPISAAQAAMSDRQGDDNIKDILNQFASEIAAVDESQNSPKLQNNTSLKELNQALRDQFESKPEPVALLKTKSRRRQKAIKSAPRISRIQGYEINRLIQKYSKSYQNGNASAMGQLFMDSRDERQQRVIEDLRQNYDFLFSNSEQRWVEFQDLNWVHSNNRAIGTGIIKSETTFRNNRRHESTANVVMELRRENKNIKIANLSISNKTTIQLAPKPVANRGLRSKAFTSREASRNTSQKQFVGSFASGSLPNREELKSLVSRFVGAYEGGDIEALGGLLADNIRSNDRSSKIEISQDYIDLFSTSSYRQMMISDINWRFTEKHAKGTGTMKAVVLSKSKEVTTVEGKIQFVAKKINNKVLITHLYHIAHAK